MSRGDAFHHVLSRLNQAASGGGGRDDWRRVYLDDLRQLLNDWNRLDDAYRKLVPRVEALQLNADRYAWLRDPDNRDGLEPEDCIVVGIAEGEDIVWLEQLDQAIDAIMGAKP